MQIRNGARANSRKFASGALALLALSLLSSQSAPARTQAPAAPAGPAASGVEYDPTSLATELRRLHDELAASASDIERIRALRLSLPDRWIVKTADARFEIPAEPLRTRLFLAEQDAKQREAKTNEALTWLADLAAQSSAATASGGPDLARARPALNAILSRPEFAAVRPPNWWDLQRRRIAMWVARGLDRLFRMMARHPYTGHFLFWLGIVAAVGWLAYWIMRRWLAVAQREELVIGAAPRPVRTWQEWVRAARAAAGRSDYREAIHSAYWAGISRLEEAGAWPPDRTRTPREYLRLLAESEAPLAPVHGPRRTALTALTARLERVWYGYRAATEADYRDSLAQLEALGCQLP